MKRVMKPFSLWVPLSCNRSSFTGPVHRLSSMIDAKKQNDLHFSASQLAKTSTRLICLQLCTETKPVVNSKAKVFLFEFFANSN